MTKTDSSRASSPGRLNRPGSGRRGGLSKEEKRILALFPDGVSNRTLSNSAKQVRFQLFREAEAILVQDEMPVIPIYSYQVSGLIRPGVEGFYTTMPRPDGSVGPNLQDLHPFRYVTTPRLEGK